MKEITKKIIVGYDLCSDYSQISYYSSRTGEPESVGLGPNQGVNLIPTVLYYDEVEDEWFYGSQALAMPQKGRVMGPDFLENLESEPVIQVQGMPFLKSELIEIFLQKSLTLLDEITGGQTMDYITFSAVMVNKELLTILREAGRHLGLAEERIMVETHVLSYVNYALCQKRELWLQDVGLFEYDETGLHYHHLHISRKTAPAIVQTEEMKLNDYMSDAALENGDKDKCFLNAVEAALEGKSVSTVYLTGPGFEGNWQNISLKRLCIKRRVFIGENLYAKGACYSSLMKADLLGKPTFMTLNGDMISQDIYIQATVGEYNAKAFLINAGTPWYNATNSFRVILDGTSDLVLYVENYDTKGLTKTLLRLSDFPKRPNRCTKLEISLNFTDSQMCRIEVQDLGFGDFYKTTDSRWQFDLDMQDLKAAESDQEGRVILCHDSENPVPYYLGQGGKKVYTLEELCYYIGRNIYSLDEASFDEAMIHWLKRDFGQQELALGIENLKKSGRDFKDVIKYLLSASDYYTKEEIQNYYRQLKDLEKQSPMERMKLLGDTYLKDNSLLQALSSYQGALFATEDKDAGASSEFKGNLYHNMGVTYSRLVNQKAALACFKQAYEQNRNTTSLKCYLKMLKVLHQDDVFMDTIKESRLDGASVAALLAEYDAVKANYQSSEAFLGLTNRENLRFQGNGQAYETELLSYIDGLKGTYRQ